MTTPVPTLFPHVWQTLIIEKGNFTEEEICEAVDKISAYSEDSALGLINIPYDQREYRCAYMYLYVTSHIHMVQEIFAEIWDRDHPHFTSWYENVKAKNEELSVCSVGGGPGSDIFGLALFMIRRNWPMKLAATVLDSFVEWSIVANNLAFLLSRVDGGKVTQLNYQHFSFFQTLDSTSILSVKSADLVTFVKFVSDVKGNQLEEIKNIRALLQCMKPGSLVFFLDNADGDFRQTFSIAAEASDFYNVEMIIRKEFVLSATERKIMSISNFNCLPQTTDQITASLWRKRNFSWESSTHPPLHNLERNQFRINYLNVAQAPRECVATGEIDKNVHHDNLGFDLYPETIPNTRMDRNNRNTNALQSSSLPIRERNTFHLPRNVVSNSLLFRGSSWTYIEGETRRRQSSPSPTVRSGNYSLSEAEMKREGNILGLCPCILL